MKFTTRHASRGQAVFETAIAIPLFLIGLFGVIWTFRTGILSEQVQQSVRYGGLVSALANPYESYSLYTLYATIDQNPPTHTRDCVGGSTNVVAQGHSVFWQPGATPTQVTPTCGLAILFTSTGVSSPIILYSDYVSASAMPQLTGQYGGLIYGKNTVSASQNFFRSPDVGALLNCSHLGFAVKRSLEGDGDPYTPTTVPTPFPQTVTPTVQDIIPNNVANNCYTATANSYGGPTAPY
jgi:hypothetical protein